MIIPIGLFLPTLQRSSLRSGVQVVAVETVAAVLAVYLDHLVLMHIRNSLVVM